MLDASTGSDNALYGRCLHRKAWQVAKHNSGRTADRVQLVVEELLLQYRRCYNTIQCLQDLRKAQIEEDLKSFKHQQTKTKVVHPANHPRVGSGLLTQGITYLQDLLVVVCSVVVCSGMVGWQGRGWHLCGAGDAMGPHHGQGGMWAAAELFVVAAGFWYHQATRAGAAPW